MLENERCGGVCFRVRCPPQSEPFLISLPGGVNCGHAENMHAYQALKQPEAAVKEVIRARNDYDRQVLRARPVENIGQWNRFIQFPVNDERFARHFRHRPFACSRTDQHHVFHRSP